MRLLLTIVFCCVGLVAIAFVWGKCEKWSAQKAKNLAIEKAKGAVAAIAFYCHANVPKMIDTVEDMAYLCKTGIEEDNDVKELYDSKDYLAFAYHSALRYASQFVDDDPERIAIEEYCKPKMNYLAKQHRTSEYKDRR